MAKVCTSFNLDDHVLARLDALAAQMGASRSWTASRLLDAAINSHPAGAVPAPGNRAAAEGQPTSAVADFEGNHK